MRYGLWRNPINYRSEKAVAAVLFSITISLLMVFQNCGSYEAFKNNVTSSSSFNSTSISVPPLRPLSAREIKNSLKVVFSSDMQGFSDLTSTAFDPFDNNASTRQASLAFVSQINTIAAKTADEFVLSPILKNFFTCPTSGMFNSICFKSFATKIGMLFFRRPLTDQELTDYVELGRVAALALPNEGMIEATRVVVRALIQDPFFLYRWEFGDSLGLNHFELASRISYFLIGAGPSEEFLKLAQEGGLKDKTKLRAQVTKLVASVDFQNHVSTFFAAWLGYIGFRNSTADSSLMIFDESNELVKKTLFEGSGSWKEIFESNRTFISDSMAAYYGLPLTGQAGMSWRNYTEFDRVGILSHLSFLGRWEKFGDTSPTQRGYHIHKRLFCGASAPPPPGVNVDEQPGQTVTSPCKHDKYLGSVLKPGTSCFNCHQNMDSIGFGLENYGITTAFRKTDVGQPTCYIEGKGEVRNVGSFNGIKGLVDLGISSGRFQDCLVEHWLEFGFGRRIDEPKSPLVQKNSDLLGRQKTFSDFAIEMALSDEMRTSRGEY